MNSIIQPTRKIAVKVLDLMKHGLSKGVGQPKEGEMCILAVKRYAFGLSHGDECEGLPVGSAVRSFDIALNDYEWSSNEARAKGMRRLAIAEFGSDAINQTVFVKELALATIRKIVPLALRAAANMDGNKEHKTALLEHASKCETAENLNAASDAASYAASAASAASDASYASDAASYASDAASYASDEVLCLMAEIGVEALQKAGSLGCQWLDLVKD